MFKLPICCPINKVLGCLVFAVQICTFNLQNRIFGKINPRTISFLSQIVSYLMRRHFLILLLAYFPLTATWAQSPVKPVPFTYGEELLFDVSYGWVDLAEGRMVVGKKPIVENGQPHFKIDVYGKTIGAATLLEK